MSGIYIPNLEMPKSCKDCTRMGISHCPMKEEPIIVNGYDKPLNCPLVEVPPHGDLIERSEVVSCLDRYIKFNLEQDNDISAVRALSFAEADVLRDGKGIYKKFPICIPTVIEASTK